MKNLSVRELVLMAFYVALFMVLDTFVNALPLFQMPNGGSLGISTIALLMASYQLGWKKGLVVSILSVFAQFVTGPMYTPNLLGFLLDYFIGFSVYGLACLFPNFGYFYSGVLITNLIRFVSSTISGIVCWETPLWASITYNASYMLPTLILGLVLVPLLYKALEPVLKKTLKA
ncbi:energy-coupled thiamine transporter ThiT [Dubosiella newyorkensis]|uniref:Energy-coupled thiamine transporter ThiT n=1 Tax=Dubosiella newyorkensis TaxID=1862672 RepID=A0A1U7NJQ5_9FIRM|nr:energy-coupled thiamine transporter ThiT [Dubosiella newyorkensis]OLU43883.1 hypothetical protein BO225_11505 [Dubosiella newyorkensis]